MYIALNNFMTNKWKAYVASAALLSLSGLLLYLNSDSCSTLGAGLGIGGVGLTLLAAKIILDVKRSQKQPTVHDSEEDIDKIEVYDREELLEFAKYKFNRQTTVQEVIDTVKSNDIPVRLVLEKKNKTIRKLNSKNDIAAAIKSGELKLLCDEKNKNTTLGQLDDSGWVPIGLNQTMFN